MSLEKISCFACTLGNRRNRFGETHEPTIAKAHGCRAHILIHCLEAVLENVVDHGLRLRIAGPVAIVLC